MAFEESPHKEEIIQALRDGRPVAEVAKRFPVAKRTVYRYSRLLKQLLILVVSQEVFPNRN